MVVFQEMVRRLSRDSLSDSNQKLSEEHPAHSRTFREELQKARRIKVKRPRKQRVHALPPLRRPRSEKVSLPDVRPPPLPTCLGSEEDLSGDETNKRWKQPQEQELSPGGLANRQVPWPSLLPGSLEEPVSEKEGAELVEPPPRLEAKTPPEEEEDGCSDDTTETEHVVQTAVANMPSGRPSRRSEARPEHLVLRHTTVFMPPKPKLTTRSSCWMVEWLVAKEWFEPLFACLIFVNTVVMAVEMQYYGIKREYTIKSEEPPDIWPGAEQFFNISEWFFGITFSIEILIKVCAIRFDYFFDVWNLLDVLCVLLWILGMVFISFFTLEAGVFRLVRLVRLLRMLRLVKVLNACESLYLMMSSIKASILALLWSSFLILLIQMSLALILNQMLQSFFEDKCRTIEERHEVFEYFGTFSRAFLTMFEYMLANWPDASRVLTNVHEVYVLFILGYQCIIGFAVVKVIMGVFLQVTFNMAATDDIIMVSQKERQIRTHTKKISQLFTAADLNADGHLDKAEFREMVGDDIVRQWLASMDCDVSLFARDPDVLFSLVDDGDDQLTLDELVKGVARISGTARSIDLALFADQNREIRKALQQVTNDLEELDVISQSEDKEEKEQRKLSKMSALQSLASSQKSQTGSALTSEPRPMSISSFKRRRVKPVSTLLWRRTRSQSSLARLERCYRIREAIKGPKFEGFFGALIFLSTVLMAVEVQYDGIEVGYHLGYPKEMRPAAEVWPFARDFFKVVTWVFLVAFTLEVLIKLLGLNFGFFKDPWNYLDLATVVCSMVEAAGSGIMPIDPKMLRFARLTRLLRMLKVVKAIKGFDSLHLMITSIKGSLSALLWSSALMFVVQMLIALILMEMLEAFFRLESDPMSQLRADQHEIYKYFGTFSKAMLTMFEITLANWIPCARALTERVNEWYMVFSLSHKFIIGFAVVMVVTGVFLNETFRVAATDDMIMITQRQKQIKTHTKKMSMLFKEFDEDKNGILDREEFQEMARDPSVVTWLSSMGLEVNDADTLFTMVCKESECKSEITAVELVKGIAHLKGSAKSIDMAVVMEENRELLEHLQRLKRMIARMGEDSDDEPDSGLPS